MAYIGFIIFITLGTGAAVALFIFFPAILGLAIGTTPSSHAPMPPTVSIVTIQEGAANADSGKSFDPKIITVVIGTNNTVRWINQDEVPSSIVANDDTDQGFFNATNDASGDPTDQSFLMPHESFEFTFTKAGEFGYHSVPHPHMNGTVIVLSY